MSGQQILRPEPATGFGAGLADARAELSAGLLAARPRISPKYFYDALGSELFEAICLLDEYYLTRTEAGIFAKYAREMAAAAGAGSVLIDLGAGNCAKAAKLFDVLQPKRYIAVDISADFVSASVTKLQGEYPDIEMTPLGLDFAETLDLPADVRNAAGKLFFYPGSSIGNFTILQAAQFLSRVRNVCHDGDGLLIGVDLIKDERILEAAYDDALGVTAAFNLNVLRHVNRLLGSDFDLSGWRHVALFNAAQSRVEMHLQAQRLMQVSWPGESRVFFEGERIHTENSYKYSKAGFVDLLGNCGFGGIECWTDEGNKFLVCHARAV
jgi:dimethylhistidine N-methyltransferase